MIYSEQNDEILVNLTLTGMQEAYEALVIRYQNAVTASAYSVVHNQYMAEDAAQDAFVAAWMKLDTLREPSKYGVWVCRIAKNCAKNMLVRVREYMDFDVLVRYEYDHNEYIEGFLIPDENNEKLHDSIKGLPDKVKRVIYLHYFEGLSIAEIAERTRTAVGTVKWQLHDGRQKIRKDLCAMNELESNTLVEKVMKKVEELKLMLLNNDRSPIEAAYHALLPEIEALPESTKKYSALADVLKVGWWSVKGVKSDEYLARLRDAAERSHNDEVMGTVSTIERENLSGNALIEFIRDKQIPRLEAGNYPKALGETWFWLAREYFIKNDEKRGQEALDKVLSLLKPTDVYYANVFSVKKARKKISELGDLSQGRYDIHCYSENYRVIDGNLRLISQPGYAFGFGIENYQPMYILYNLADCDRYFPPYGLKLGETYNGTDKSSLTFEADSLPITTPCGTFENCELWITKKGSNTTKTYLKSGVGVVKQEMIQSSGTTATVLKEYHLVGGDGLLPCAAGNRWEYGFEDLSPTQDCRITAEIVGADGTNVSVAHYYHFIKTKYDENDWKDMMLAMRGEYCTESEDGQEHLKDVSFQMERAQALAQTPFQIAHTNAACSVMQRIMDTDGEFNPSRTMSGHWNFFEYLKIAKDNEGRNVIDDDREYSFEWKDMSYIGEGDAGYPLLFNDIYGIFTDATGVLWSADWAPGASLELDANIYRSKVKTKLTCEAVDSITTPAGIFDDCLKLSLDIDGLSGGLYYRCGHKEYYFARSIGIVRVVTDYKNGERRSTYDLTSYTGRGRGYMPLCEGMVRRYDAIGLTDGYIGWAEYTVSGNVLFANRCGVRQL